MEKLKKVFLRNKIISILLILLGSAIFAVVIKNFLISFLDEINLFSLILGIISFIISIIVLDSVTQREKTITTVLNNQGEHTVRIQLKKAMSLCKEILSNRTLDDLNENSNFDFGDKEVELKISLSLIQNQKNSKEIFTKYDKFRKDAYENIRIQEKVYSSYIKIVDEIYGELHLLKSDIEAKNITNGL